MGVPHTDKNGNVSWVTEGAPRSRGHGFETGRGIYLIRCPDCQKENYALAVASGRCAFCGFDSNKAPS